MFKLILLLTGSLNWKLKQNMDLVNLELYRENIPNENIFISQPTNEVMNENLIKS
jgi:hypothetical protein